MTTTAVAWQGSALRGAKPFPKAAPEHLENGQLRSNLAHATGVIRAKRAKMVAELEDWEALRQAAAEIKHDVRANLADLLVELEGNVVAAGGQVHWAADGAEACQMVANLTREAGADQVVKVKSMVSQEIELNSALHQAGITPLETDLAELIVQLAGDTPSHILVPAIHRSRGQIRQIFLDHMSGCDPNLSDDPQELAMAARSYLRRHFMTAQVAVSGANFAIAQTGQVGVVESEGNGRMCLTLPHSLITVMGIEKVLPTPEDLEVFLQLLPRSATGERMNPYTSIWRGVTPGDGPANFHLILLDNGRTRALADPKGREALGCIRCASCLNICPVYERVGGHAYGSTYPGPIGAVLTPLLTGTTGRQDPSFSLPFASTLCGACADVCPVKIDLPGLLLDGRRKVVEANPAPLAGTDLAMKAASVALAGGRRFGWLVRLTRLGRILAPRTGLIRRLPPPFNGWTNHRNVVLPRQPAFRTWWRNWERR